MAQNQNYAKTSSKTAMTKEIASSTLGSTIHGGGKSTSGPTGSAISYPKNSANKFSTNWNPQKTPASTYGINGI